MKLLTQPGDGVAPLIDALNRAETSIDLTIFRFDEAHIEQALADAVKRGVSVRALIAHVNGSSAEALRQLELRLLGGGVTVARTDTALARYHSKFIIVDRQELLVLGFNFTRQDIERSRSFGISTKRRDLVQEALKVFEADIKRQPYQAECPDLVVSPANARQQLAAFIKGAKSELAIYDPRLSDPATLRLLAERIKAGVVVRVIGRASEKAPPEMQIRPLTKLRLHTRMIARDRAAVFIGSQSLRTLELDGRREVGILCQDRAVVGSVLSVFEDDWAASQNEPARSLQPVSKLAKKVAKVITSEIPPIEEVIDKATKEIDADPGEIAATAEVLHDSVTAAVKDAVKSAVEQVLAQNKDESKGAEQ